MATGTTTVAISNVIIKNNLTGHRGVHIVDGISGPQILHSEIHSPNGAYVGMAIGDGIAIICGNYIHHFEYPISVVGLVYVQANFVEQLRSDSPTAHVDRIEVYAGSDVYVWGNSFILTEDSTGR